MELERPFVESHDGTRIGFRPTGLGELAAAGDPEGVVVTILRRLLDMSDEQIDQYRSSPTWADRVAMAGVNLREARVEDAYEFEPERFADLRVPTLLLVGQDSPPHMHGVIDAIDHALPNSRVDVLPGQGHVATQTAPELLARRILEFLAPRPRR